MDACWSNQRCFKKQLQMFKAEKNKSVQMMTICCPQTGMQMCFA